jgi:quinolinate synthase
MQIVNSKSQTPNLKSQISNLKSRLGDSLVILGHHYQRDEVIQFADFRGDSLKLAQDAIRTDARYIAFCGVHFMAETAAILARPDQTVLIPDPAAGCFLADTASLEAVEAAWAHLSTVLDVEAEFTPVTYVNSSAALKAFCGRHGGVVCTSSNAAQVLEWALAQRPRVFFFPDQHLGRNTALRMDIGPEEALLWDTRRPPDAAAIRRAKVVLWPGCCNVHQRFRPEQVRAVRERHPVIRVIVHPECTREVVGLADDAGSTAHIVRQVEAAPPGTEWAIGTEYNLVHRLAQEHPDQFIISLADLPPLCRTMNMITQRNLAQVLEGLVQGEHPSPTRGGVLHPVVVEPETAHWARIALQRMLELSR